MRHALYLCATSIFCLDLSIQNKGIQLFYLYLQGLQMKINKKDTYCLPNKI